MGDTLPLPSQKPTSIEELRRRIDEIDAQVIGLLNQRGAVVVEIGDLKRKNSARIYAPLREIEVLRHACEQNKGPLPDAAVRAIFREVMSACIALEHPLKVAYLGPQGTFSHLAAQADTYTHLAAQAKFGRSVEYIPCRDILGIFRAVASGAANLGVVPVENSIDGGVTDTLDAFMGCPLPICSEMLMEVHHCLLAPTPDTVVEKVYSKPQVFAQCGHWLSEHYPDAELIPVSSTARACEVAAQETGAAAIAHVAAAATYGLAVVHKNIEDSAHNVTRFVVVGQESCPPSGRDKTSLVLSVAHRAGALVEALEPFRTHAVSLTRIESRPSKRDPWEYYFFVDFEGHQEDPRVRDMIEQVKKACNYLKVLGSYPLAETTVSIE